MYKLTYEEYVSFFCIKIYIKPSTRCLQSVRQAFLWVIILLKSRKCEQKRDFISVFLAPELTEASDLVRPSSATCTKSLYTANYTTPIFGPSSEESNFHTAISTVISWTHTHSNTKRQRHMHTKKKLKIVSCLRIHIIIPPRMAGKRCEWLLFSKHMKTDK